MAEHERRAQLRKLRTECSKRIAGLDLARPRDVHALCTQLAASRRRPIRLVPLAMPSSHPCGMWVMAEGDDLIFYDANTTGAHQEHIILHELGHIICCHRGTGVLDDESARALFPNLSPDIVRDMLMRTDYDTVQEQEAEISAYLLAELLTRKEIHAVADDRHAESVIDRIANTLVW